MYGFLISLGILFSVLIAEKQIKSQEEKGILWDGLLWLLIGGIIGARLYHVIDYGNYYLENTLQIIKVWEGGLGIFGGIFGGIISITLFLRYKKQNILKWLDIIALVMPLGQAIGRWGNHFNNELLPYSYYESGANFLLFLILIIINRRKNYEGVLFYSYLFGYSVIRFILEPIKELSWAINSVNVAQSISFIVIIISGIMLWKLHLHTKKQQSL